MEESKARAVVSRLRDRGVFAHVHPVGVYEYSVRVVIPDGREAVWDADGAAGLEAVVLRDGVLVGLVEEIPGSADLDVDGVVETIAKADNDAPLSSRPPSQTAEPPPPTPTPRGGLLRRLTGR